MNEVILNQTSAVLRKAALNEEAKAFILYNHVLFTTLKKSADRYMCGDTL